MKMNKILYELRLMETEAGVGYFSCVPETEFNFEELVSVLRSCPFDEFLRRHLLMQISSWKKDDLKKRIKQTDDQVVLSLFYEVCILNEHFNDLKKLFKQKDLKKLSVQTPLIYIKSRLEKDWAVHFRWIEMFGKNILEHKPLVSPSSMNLPFPYSKEELDNIAGNTAGLQEIHKEILNLEIPRSFPRPSPLETSMTALEKLERLGIICEEEKRHTASLSPIALLRKWKVNISVQNGRHNYRLSGIQTSYGRGLDLEYARAALNMEMIERCSSFAGFDSSGVIGYEKEYPLTFASFSQLQKKEIAALNPNSLALETPYKDEPLHWIEGIMQTAESQVPVLVPAQCVFLFCNLDEIKLFAGLGSTGLASGNTMEEAKVSAIHEIIERDCDGTTPYNPSQCFNLETEEPKLNALLRNYVEAGIRVQFQDITSDMGLPCCKCFVINKHGQVIKGTGANLNAGKALISALTETPYPFPYGEPSDYGLYRLTRVPFENLPDYSLGNGAGDLAILEKLLISNKYNPIYIDLTRKDIGIPVVRAVIPGMEITGDFDRFSRVHPRLFANYLKIFEEKK
ncbi:Cyclodehydratase ATP-ad Mg2+-binding domain-containing protein [Desulfonema limicola]|uniref:Cyclodehydratase ATP-ad Mg2+-binding domain-containing protein n=1 Tax=Desulfonema limicola TaxID=45656 RepID=A0A975GHC6_9BACT|nr:YcaO-like family protein [Desulfonema limicola]QTA81043.1 Cyclodehydratase ATP-ad Mg2+-binding domain-containing protein [Desulfonema limicola]